MGFLAGIAYKQLGCACIWRRGGKMEVWTYWTDKILRYDGAFLEQKIKLRDVTRIDEVSEESIEDRAMEAKLSLAGDLLSKEHLSLAAGVFLSPIVALPIVLARGKAIDAKDEKLRQQATEKLREIRASCFDLTIRGGEKALLVCLPDLGAKILTDHGEG
jgi:hypothetical protein